MLLSDQDFSRWTQALANLPTSSEDIMSWMENELRSFFPFKQLLLAHGELAAGAINVTDSLSSGFDAEYIGLLTKNFELNKRTSIAWWLQNRQPFFIDPASPPTYTSEFELDEIRRLRLINIAAHGIVNLKSNMGSYFSFAGVSEPLSNWHLAALRLIAPVLNELFFLAISKRKDSKIQIAKLTKRQLDIVRLVLAYRDDKTIARALGISDKTVRNQLSEAYSRLGIKKRTELIALFS